MLSGSIGSEPICVVALKLINFRNSKIVLIVEQSDMRGEKREDRLLFEKHFTLLHIYHKIILYPKKKEEIILSISLKLLSNFIYLARIIIGSMSILRLFISFKRIN